jgi:hypothetical protein
MVMRTANANGKRNLDILMLVGRKRKTQLILKGLWPHPWKTERREPSQKRQKTA